MENTLKSLMRAGTGAVILVVLFALAGWFIWEHNQVADDEGAPLGPSSSLRDLGDSAEVDFAACVPGTKRFDVAFGSTTIEIRGKYGSDCVMAYGGEIENPNWDGQLDIICRVPGNLGKIEFPKGSAVVDLSAIDEHCS